MAQSRTRKIVTTGILGAVCAILGITHLGFIPWFGGVSLTIMQVPVIIGAILEGPVVGAGIGLIFGIFSLIQAAVAPNSPADMVFTNPLISVLPRLFIGPAAYWVWNALKKHEIPAMLVSGIAGSLTNTILVLGMFGILQLYPWPLIGATAVANGLPEAAASGILTLIIVAAWKNISIHKKEGANLEG